MVQIATAEQVELRESVATSIPLIETGAGILGPVRDDGTLAGRIAIDSMKPGEFDCQSLTLRDNPNMGWDLEHIAIDQRNEIAALEGLVPASVRLTSSTVELKIDEFSRPKDPDKAEKIAEYRLRGPISALNYHRVD